MVDPQPDKSVRQVPGQCRPGTGAASQNCQVGTGATVSSMNRVRTRLSRDLLWCRCGASAKLAAHPSGKVLVRGVGLGGIEPPTSALSVLRSNRLSYSPVPGRL